MRLTVLLLAAACAAFALSPLESDLLVCDRDVAVVDGAAALSFDVPPGRRVAGWYANVECPAGFALWANGEFVAEFKPEDLPRTRIGGLELADYVPALRPGANRIELRTAQAGSIWLRMWLSDNAWYPANFHAHTRYSDGAYSVHDLLQLALGQGARSYAITDHNSTAQCYDTAFHAVGSLYPIRGTEWTSELGHANMMGYEGSSVVDSACSVRALLDEASYRGAFLQINHPCDDELGFGWDRYPALDSGVDMIEVFNNLTYFPPSPGDNDREAVSWWHSLLQAGRTIAATGNSDYHGTIPGEGGPMESQTRVWAPSNEPDSILKYTKLGQGMILDESNDGRIYVYADTNNNGSWDLVMGQHARITTTRTVKFRAEIEDADFLDDFWVYNRTGTVHNHWFTNPFGPWDHAYEWTASYGAGSRDFVRAYHENSINDPELMTNAIYINHPDYELGPTRLVSTAQNWPDSGVVAEPETLRLRVQCAAGYSPWRFGLAFAFDTADFAIAGWQTSGPGVGAIDQRSSGAYSILEWRGGYTWGNRLPVSTSFNYWVAVTPKHGGHAAALWRSWAHDRIQLIDNEPATGFWGPESRWWHRDSLFARTIDAQPLTIDLPGATVDSGAAFTPRATVRNNGNTAVSFPVSLAIGAYSGSGSVTALGPGATQQVTFTPDWQPTRGSHALRCVTMLAGDRTPANDTITAASVVNVHDVAAVAVVTPTGTITAGPVTPRATVRNNGTLREACKVHFTVDAAPAYHDSLFLADGLPFADTTVEFADWVAGVGDWNTACYTVLAGDQRPLNDTARGTVTVRPAGTIDVAVAAITAPTGSIDTGVAVVPGATVRNDGTLAVDFTAWFAIDSAGTVIHSASAAVNGLGAGQVRTVTFAEWPRPHAPGQYAARCSVYVANDSNPANDVLTGSFRITVRTLDPGWFELEPMPLAPSGKTIKDGGWLAWDSLSARVYAAKGYKTGDFYSYDPAIGTWTELPEWPLGLEAKAPYKGAVGVSDNRGTIYAVKGNNKLGFWKYSVFDSVWTQLADIPLGQSGKKVKGGSDLVYVDAGDSQYVYLLKGYKTEFYRYNVGFGDWRQLADAPAGLYAKYDKGSWLVPDPDRGRLLAHKAKKHEFFGYDLGTGVWAETLPGMPFFNGQTGKTKKSKDGGDAARIDRYVYSLKGGNTQDFYAFDLVFGEWSERETIPRGVGRGTGRVKGGGSMTADGAVVYATKGNKRLGLWRYVPGVAGENPTPKAQVPRQGAQEQCNVQSAACKVEVVQNPARGRATIRWHSSLGIRHSTLSLYDASGRLVLRRAIDNRQSSFDIALSPGVYLVRLSGGITATRKLVIE
jgi:hypothetical protein